MRVRLHGHSERSEESSLTQKQIPRYALNDSILKFYTQYSCAYSAIYVSKPA
jgi:hypothetical protein